MPTSSLPTVSLLHLNSKIVHSQPNLPRVQEAAVQVATACEINGFFYIKDFEHLLPHAIFKTLDTSARTFFNLPEDIKMKMEMKNSGSAWRGFFPVGSELTSGIPDLKEGIYFGTQIEARRTESSSSSPALPPLHGPNQFPDNNVPEMREAVIAYMKGCEEIGHTLMGLISVGLQLPSSNYINTALTKEPLELFRIFHYPPRQKTQSNPLFAKSTQGVQEHTDYGLLTILRQDDVGGLQVRDQTDPKKWIDAPPVPGTLVINIGDMLEAMTHGLFRSTPHRVLQPQGADSMRVSMPYFFDPGFTAVLRPLPLNDDILKRAKAACDRREILGYKRWDASGSTLKLIDSGREVQYGSYVLSKVAKCFPDLFMGVVVSKL